MSPHLHSEIKANGTLRTVGRNFVRKLLSVYPATVLPVLVFLAMVGYVPGVASDSAVGRWSLLTVIGIPTILITAIERFDWSRTDTKLGVALAAWLAASQFWTVSRWDTAGASLHWLALAGVFVI